MFEEKVETEEIEIPEITEENDGVYYEEVEEEQEESGEEEYIEEEQEEADAYEQMLLELERQRQELKKERLELEKEKKKNASKPKRKTPAKKKKPELENISVEVEPVEAPKKKRTTKKTKAQLLDELDQLKSMLDNKNAGGVRDSNEGGSDDRPVEKPKKDIRPDPFLLPEKVERKVKPIRGIKRGLPTIHERGDNHLFLINRD